MGFVRSRGSPLRYSPRGTRTRRSASDRWLVALLWFSRYAIILLVFLYGLVVVLHGTIGFFYRDNDVKIYPREARDFHSLAGSDGQTNIHDKEVAVHLEDPAKDSFFSDRVSHRLRGTDSKLTNELLDSYNPAWHPILNATYLPDTRRPLQVRLIMGAEDVDLVNLTVPHGSRFLAEGAINSKFVLVGSALLYRGVERVATTGAHQDHQPVWIVDFTSLEQDCHTLERIVRENYSQKMSNDDFSLVIVETSGSSDVVQCPRLQNVLPQANIRLVKRSIVTKRHWDSSAMFVNVGKISENKGSEISSGPVLHMPFALLEQFAASIRSVWNPPHRMPANLAEIDRKKDVAHFWRGGDNSHYSFLRSHVSRVVRSLEGSKANGRKIHTLVRDSKDDMTHAAYIKSLISSKIVVVAQRDEWEDHYRLLESLACGAMVVTDSMLALPQGLENGKHLVSFDSTESLIQTLKFYLNPRHDSKRVEIAKRGFNAAMESQRPWHRLESILFGMPLTDSNIH